MNRNVLIVLFGAILVSVLVAVLVQMSLGGGGQDRVTVEREPSVEILVASRDIGVGQELVPNSMRWQTWPEGSVFDGLIVREDGQSISDALEGRVRRDVAEGEPLLSTIVLSEARGNFVAASLMPGYRAVAVDVNAVTSAGGFVGPGDYVDVILTYGQRIRITDSEEAQQIVERNIDRTATETILQNIKILALDQTAEKGDTDKVRVGRTVTLEVTQRQAEKLALASRMGDLTLTLRPIGDDKILSLDELSPTITDRRMVRVVDEIVSEINKGSDTSAARGRMVRVYNGAVLDTAASE